MSSSSAIRAAWDTKIWQHATVQGWTEQIHPYELATESTTDAAKTKFGQQINFFTYQVLRETELLAFGQYLDRFTVEVSYYLQETNQGSSTFNTVSDRLDTLDGLVISQLGVRWNNTVDVYQGAEGTAVSLVTVDDRKCWKGRVLYKAQKLVTI